MQACDSRWQMMPASPTDKASASLLSGVLLLLLLHLMLSEDVLDRSRTNSISARQQQRKRD
jgi:ABC-type Fe3+ transport system permease subunit